MGRATATARLWQGPKGVVENAPPAPILKR